MYQCLQFTEGCSQRHSRVHPLPLSDLNAVFLFVVFIWFPNLMNATHESIRDLTMFSMFFLKRFIEFKKKIHWRKEECK